MPWTLLNSPNCCACWATGFADHDHLDASLQRFVGNPAYGVGQLRGDLDRFTFLLGGDDGETLFNPNRQR
jgi:hypothetical protein